MQRNEKRYSGSKKQKLAAAMVLMASLWCHSMLMAQDKYSLGFFRSLPVGKYKSTDIASGSFAKAGWGIAFEDKARLDTWPENFFLVLHLSYQQNALDNIKLQQVFSEALNNRTEVEEAEYKPLLVTVGPFFQIPVSEIVDINIETGVGVIFTNIDPFVITMYSPNGNVALQELIGFKGSPNFSYLLGLSANFRLTDFLKVGVFGQYSAAREKVKPSVGTQISPVQSNFDLAFFNTGIKVTAGF